MVEASCGLGVGGAGTRWYIYVCMGGVESYGKKNGGTHIPHHDVVLYTHLVAVPRGHDDRHPELRERVDRVVHAARLHRCNGWTVAGRAFRVRHICTGLISTHLRKCTINPTALPTQTHAPTHRRRRRPQGEACHHCVAGRPSFLGAHHVDPRDDVVQHPVALVVEHLFSLA